MIPKTRRCTRPTEEGSHATRDALKRWKKDRLKRNESMMKKNAMSTEEKKRKAREHVESAAQPTTTTPISAHPASKRSLEFAEGMAPMSEDWAKCCLCGEGASHMADWRLGRRFVAGARSDTEKTTFLDWEEVKFELSELEPALVLA